MNYVPMRMVALAVSLVVSQAAPQTPPPQFRASIDLMRIETTVLDRRTRKPVRGLTAADFIIRVNGVPQSIEALDEVAVAARDANRAEPFVEAPRDVASNALTHPRLFVIVMDDALASRDAFAAKKGKDIAHAVVDGLGPTDVAAVVFAQDNRHAQDFTADRAALRKAIDTFTPRPLNPIMAGIMSISVLERSSAFLRRMPGYRRSLVWITLGPGGADLEDESLTSWQLEPLRSVNVTGGEAQEALARATNRVLTGAVAAVPIYAYSIVGIRPVTVNETKGGRMPSPFGNEAMDKVARGTGGRQIYNTNAPDAEVASMFAELSSYYTIAFRSSFPMDGKLRRLQVDVKRRDVVVVPPDTSFATPKDLASARAEMPARLPSRLPSRLIDALSGPMPRGDIRLAMGNVPVAVAGGKSHAVALTLGMPSPAAGAGRQELALSLFVYDGEGQREILKQSQTVTLQPLPDDTVQLSEVAIPLTLGPGRYLVRVAVAETVSGATGSVYTSVTVPDFARDALSLSGVAIGRSEGRAIGGREAIQSLLPFAPTVVREFSTSDHVGALVRVHQAAGRAVPVRLQTQIVNADALVVVSESTPRNASDFSTGAGVEHRYELPLRTLSPGEYLLRFMAEAAGRRSTREVRFSVR